jgi:hypothetical protein
MKCIIHESILYPFTVTINKLLKKGHTVISHVLMLTGVWISLLQSAL